MQKTPVFLGSVKKRMPGNLCPSCGRLADGGTSVNDEPNTRPPQEGDWAICLYCGTLNRYGPDLRLRVTTDDERRSIDNDPRVARMLRIASLGVSAWIATRKSGKG